MSLTKTTRFVLLVAAWLSLGANPAAADTNFEILGEYFVTGLSSDGNVAAVVIPGFFGPARWTAATGPVPLGLSSGEFLGTGGGYTRISADGNRLCSSIVNADTTLATQGLWTKGVGWQRLMPPYVPGGGPLDGHEGSTYDVSGDGNTVVGLVWVGGHGHASAWTEAGGIIDLGTQATTSSSRANTTNYDGTLVGGWSSSPVTGAWQPTIWENGVMTVLNPTDVRSEVQCTNDAGTFLGGMLYNASTNIREPALWFKSNGQWSSQMLGTLPGSPPFSTACSANGIAPDGSLVIGEYLFDNFSRTGFVWTFDEGLMTADDYFANLGVTVPADFNITALTAMTPDGRRIAGHGYTDSNPGVLACFLVDLWQASPVPDALAVSGLRLAPAYPNPFNPSTSLTVGVERDGLVQLEIFDTRGALVRRLHGGELMSGDHSFQWDGRSESGRLVPSGTYLARVRDEAGMGQTRRLTLVK